MSSRAALWALAAGSSGCLGCAHSLPDTAWYAPRADAAPANRFTYHSRYQTMRDGVRIAMDVYVPEAAPGAAFPTILHQTRYFRGVQPRWLTGVLLGDPFDHTPLHRAARQSFVRHGYAWIDVDVRGSGASFGTQVCPFSPDEVRDADEIVRWISAQPWSNGKVGALGVSYDGTAADFLLVSRNPAVRATAPLFASFDAYTDIAFPGGARLAWFTQTWGHMNAALDRNRLDEVAGWWTNLFLVGVKPVEGADAATLDGAVRAHAANYDVEAGARELTFRDDISTLDKFHRDGVPVGLAGHPSHVSGTIGIFSSHTYVDDLRASGAAILSYSGWFDGAYPLAAIKRYLTVRTPGSCLVLGPWNHGGGSNVGPPDGPRNTVFDHAAELRRFFDTQLEGVETGLAGEKPIHYFTMGEGRWKSADAWPVPAKTITLYFGAGHALSSRPPASGADSYLVDATAGTGDHARWNSLVGGVPVAYPDRGAEDRKLLVYDSAALSSDMEVTGHPLASLWVSSTATDGTFFVYLEDVDESGAVTYVTEGVLRAIHRKLSTEPPPYVSPEPYRTFEKRDAAPLVPGEPAELVFDLLPTSYRFSARHKVRVAIAGADVNHFAGVPAAAPTITLHRNTERPSSVSLPVVATGARQQE